MEIRQLVLDPSAIFTFIKAQSGSLAKALSESIMNSIDAFASSVHITITSEGYEISDQGVGFKSRNEIYNWFETLGFIHPPESNHRAWGVYGMGRAQQWAYAKTTWYSNQFIMEVDVQSKGLDYTLTESLTPTTGTTIRGTFYKPLQLSEVIRVIQELTSLVQYVETPIVINSKQVNTPPNLTEWDLETPEAYFQFKDINHTLTVYNQGVLVGQFPSYLYQRAGIIVTKPGHALALNLARNAILEAECSLWPTLLTNIPVISRAQTETSKPRRPSEDKLAEIVDKIIKHNLYLVEELKQTPWLFTSVFGREVSSSLALFDKIVVCPSRSEAAKLGMRNRIGLFLDGATLHRWKVDSAFELKDKVLSVLNSNLNRLTSDRANPNQQPLHAQTLWLHSALSKATWGISVESVFPGLVSNRRLLSLLTITPHQKLAFRKANRILPFALKKMEKLLRQLQPQLPAIQIGGALPQIILSASDDNYISVVDSSNICLNIEKLAPALQRGFGPTSFYLYQGFREILSHYLPPETVSSILLESEAFHLLVTETAITLFSSYLKDVGLLGSKVSSRQLNDLSAITP